MSLREARDAPRGVPAAERTFAQKAIRLDDHHRIVSSRARRVRGARRQRDRKAATSGRSARSCRGGGQDASDPPRAGGARFEDESHRSRSAPRSSHGSAPEHDAPAAQRVQSKDRSHHGPRHRDAAATC